MDRMKLLVTISSTLFALVSPTLLFADPIYSLNVNVVQVFDDDGANGTPLDPSNDANLGYLYESQVNQIWAQAGIQVNFTLTSLNSAAAQRLTQTAMDELFASEPVPIDTLQIFFVMDHPGTGYTGSGTGWVDNPLGDPENGGRSAGINQLYIDGTFPSNGRGAMANEGIAVDPLSRTIAHEIGHGLGLRHVDELELLTDPGSVQDPRFTLSHSLPNLMWSAGVGPGYNGGLDGDPNLNVLQENSHLTAEQIAAAIYNGTRLDPDGNSIGVLRLIAVPEPTIAGIWIVCAVVAFRRRR